MWYQNFHPGDPDILLPERSYFRESSFVLDDNFLNDPNEFPPKAQISMWKTDRLRIQGCDFTNTQTVDASEKRGEAIYSHDGNYMVTARCTDMSYPCDPAYEIPSTFTGWHRAIWALESASGRPITVRNSVFEKNMIGVEIKEVDYSQIYKNEFKLGGHPFQYEYDPIVDDQNHLGIFANGTQHFSIEENTLYRPLQDAPYEGHGILVYNSMGAENQVYKNDLSRLKTGVNGWQLNWNVNGEGGAPVGSSGLQFLCNSNSQNDVDFETSSTQGDVQFEYINAGIRWRQGSFSPAISAANTFSTPNSDPLVFSHFTINTDQPYAYFSNSDLPQATEIGPLFMSSTIVNESNSCPSNYTTDVEGPVKKTQLLQQKAAYEGVLYNYNQLIDNGETPETITDIELTWPSQAWELRDVLMLRSPFNSEEVLIAAIDRKIMPNAMLLEVLLANPDALRSGNVIRHAQTVTIPTMPEYMIDLLWASRDQSTLRTAMESTLSHLHEQVQRTQKIIYTQKMFADSVNSAPDSTLYYLSLVKTVEGNYSRAAAYADRAMFSQAIGVIDSMQAHYRLSVQRYSEMTGLKNLYSLLGSAHDAGQNVANLDSTKVQSLIALAENGSYGIAARKAQNALCFHYDICYDIDGQAKIAATLRKPKPKYEELLAKLNTARAYPNPADQYVTIAYTLLKPKEQTNLLIFDNLGKQIESRILGELYEGQQLFDIRKLPNGMYFFQISQDGEKVSEGKFVVTH